VLDEVELGISALRKDYLRGAGNPDLAVVDHKRFVIALHRRPAGLMA
jgi:hypothetical protein